MSDKNVKKLISAGIIGALYAVLTVVLAPISYGPVQLRVSEALCILPFFLPYTAWGLFIGCAIANLMSTAGVLDVIFGSLATLASCLCIAACGRKSRTSFRSKAVACLMPALFNGLIVGAMLTVAVAGLDPLKSLGAFLIYAGQVALGELVIMFAVGLPLMKYLPRQKFFDMLD